MREGGRQMRVNNRVAAAGKRVWVSTTALGLHFSREGEDRQNVASDSLLFGHVTAGGGSAMAGLTDLSPAAAGQRGKLYRHLSAR